MLINPTSPNNVPPCVPKSFPSPDVATTQLVCTFSLPRTYPYLTFAFADNDTAELECICRSPNAGTLIPTCEACVAQFDSDNNDDDDNDRNGLSNPH
jgi:hypothetical protein